MKTKTRRKKNRDGINVRPDSPFYQLHLKATATRPAKRICTDILIGTTAKQRKDSRILVEAEYFRLMNETPAQPSAQLPEIGFREFANWYDDTEIPLHRGKGRERQILKHLHDGFDHLLISQIDFDVVKEWRAQRLSTRLVIDHFGGPKGPRYVFHPPSKRTVHREETLLRQILVAAVPKYLKVSPLSDAAMLKFEKPAKRNIALIEEERMLAAIRNPADRVIWMIGVDSLPRCGDILDLRKIDVLGTTFNIRHPKEGTPNDPPISARVRAALDALPSTAGPMLFPHRQTHDDPDRNTAVFGKMLRRAAKRAGVPWGKKVGGNTFHWSTRRTGATRMLAEGGEGIVAQVAKIGGWIDGTVPLREYIEATQQDTQDVMAMMDKARAKAARKATRTRKTSGRASTRRKAHDAQGAA